MIWTPTVVNVFVGVGLVMTQHIRVSLCVTIVFGTDL